MLGKQRSRDMVHATTLNLFCKTVTYMPVAIRLTIFQAEFSESMQKLSIVRSRKYMKQAMQSVVYYAHERQDSRESRSLSFTASSSMLSELLLITCSGNLRF